ALAQIASGDFSGGDTGIFRPIVDSLLIDDPYMLLADFDSYLAAQDRAEQAYRDQDRWTRMSILNVARCGYFSSDRSIREYCDEIWKISPIEIAVRTEDEGEATSRLGRPAEAEAASLPQLTPEEGQQLRDLPLLVGLDVLHASRGTTQ